MIITWQKVAGLVGVSLAAYAVGSAILLGREFVLLAENLVRAKEYPPIDRFFQH